MNDEKRIVLPEITPLLSRRRFVTGAAARGALLGLGISTNLSFAATSTRQPIATLRGSSFKLDIGYKAVNFTGKERPATVINGSIPGPIMSAC